MKKVYETERDAFLGGYASVDEADADTMQFFQGKKKAYNLYFHGKEHAYLSGVSAAKLEIAIKALRTLLSAKDADEAADAAESLADAAKDAYLSAKAVAYMTGYMSSYASTADAKAAKKAKVLWKDAQSFAALAKTLASS